MRTKKFFVPSIFFALLIVAFIAASLIFCYTTKPAVMTGEFPFSIIYEYKGETTTLEGVYKCEFSGSSTIWNEHERYWNGESIIEYDGEYDIPNVIYRDETMSLAVYENMHAGYFMGDPLYASWFPEGPHPEISYYDYINEISINDDGINREELLEEIGFKLVDFSYGQPIENSFSFSGILYEADNVMIFVMIAIVFLLLCIIFVRKDKEYKYSRLDKWGIALNFVTGGVALPFITIVCFFHGLIGGEDFFSQVTYNIPFISIVCLALSVVFRRREFKKTGFYIQFAGALLFFVWYIVVGSII